MVKLNITQQFAFEHAFTLAFKKGTRILEKETLAQKSEFRMDKKPWILVNKRIISFKHGILTISVKLNDDDTEQVYIKVEEEQICILCSLGTDKNGMSITTFLLFCDLLYIHHEFDFEKYYWPDFFDKITGKSKYLEIINDRKGLSIYHKSKYAEFFKPGMLLPEFVEAPKPIERKPLEKWEEILLDVSKKELLAYSLEVTHFTQWHSNHFPFLIPFSCLLNNDGATVKSCLHYQETTDLEQLAEVLPQRERLHSLCLAMKANALLLPYEFLQTAERKQIIDKQNQWKKEQLFAWWHQVLPIVAGSRFCFYHYSYGMRNVRKKPFKKDMKACIFSTKSPKLYFVWKDKGDYFELSLYFKLGGKVYSPEPYLNAFYFITTGQAPLTFYLLDSLQDVTIIDFFRSFRFKLSVLKVHMPRFQKFLKELIEVYEVKSI